MDYLRNRGAHFNLVRDRNRLGAATLNTDAALSAMNLTFGDFGCTGGSVSDNIDCVIENGGGIGDFANEGLGAGSGVDEFAFSGMNRNFRGMGIISPLGFRSTRLCNSDCAEISAHSGRSSALRPTSTTTWAALSLPALTRTSSPLLASMTGQHSFSDRPTRRLHQIGFSFLMELPLGIHVNTTTKIKSGLASSMFLPPEADEIFFSDLDGDGVTQDPITGTNRGSYTSNRVTAGSVNNVINKYNSTVAGSLGPAAQALVQAGLLLLFQPAYGTRSSSHFSSERSG